MTINERIKFIRNNAKLNQSEFAKTLGLAQTTVSLMEQEGSSVKEQNIRLICKMYRINYLWLKEEFGEPYMPELQIINDEVMREYKLDKFDKKIIEQYVKMKASERKVLKSYLKNILRDTEQ